MTERQTEVCGLLKAGLTYKEIEDRTGYDQHNARKLALRLGLAYTDKAKRAEQLERVKSTVQLLGFDYVGGYTNNLSKITLRCKEGHTFERLWTSVIIDKSTMCPECARIKREKHEAETERKRMAKRTIKGKQITYGVCPVCGAMTFNGKYCSERCKNRAKNKTKEVKRTRLLKGTTCDPTITLDKLWMRDGGICKLCGGPCDMEDYETRGDAFIAGDRYPSIDHVKPLAAGGTHTWDNVQLAHRICNSVKGKRYAPLGVKKW